MDCFGAFASQGDFEFYALVVGDFVIFGFNVAEEKIDVPSSCVGDDEAEAFFFIVPAYGAVLHIFNL